MTDYSGQQVGHYHLERLLGEGGFAQVYLGTHIHLHTPAAIKVLRTILNSEDIEQFRSEARLIAHLVHPHIVRILDFGFHEGQIPYLVMDYLPGGTLRQRHPRGTKVPLMIALGYVRQVAAALQYAHDASIVHRDVKPENMLIGRGDAIQLADFGIAVLARSSRSQGPLDIAGTVTYMAPEQIQGPPRIASDQYALAVVLYEWLSGHPPFQGTFAEVAVKHCSTPPPSLRHEAPEISLEIEQIIMRALEKDWRARFPSIKAFAEALEQATTSTLLLTPARDALPATQARTLRAPAGLTESLAQQAAAAPTLAGTAETRAPGSAFSYYQPSDVPPPRLPPPPMALNYLPLFRGHFSASESGFLLGYAGLLAATATGALFSTRHMLPLLGELPRSYGAGGVLCALLANLLVLLAGAVFGRRRALAIPLLAGAVVIAEGLPTGFQRGDLLLLAGQLLTVYLVGGLHERLVLRGLGRALLIFLCGALISAVMIIIGGATHAGYLVAAYAASELLPAEVVTGSSISSLPALSLAWTVSGLLVQSLIAALIELLIQKIAERFHH